MTAATLTVVLDGATHTLPMAHGQTVLEAAEAGGLTPPYSCRDGQCATCMCTLTAGTVQMQQNGTTGMTIVNVKLAETMRNGSVDKWEPW